MIKFNNKGFTLIETMITMVILMIGMLAMGLMQVQAIKANQTAFSRTSANEIALTFLEELKRLEFDNTNLSAGTDLDAGKAPAGGTPTPTNADHQYAAANLPALANSYTVNGNYIEDKQGNQFQLFWNVQNTTITVGGTTYTPSATIRLFMYWGASLGNNSLTITTIKYNNSSS